MMFDVGGFKTRNIEEAKIYCRKRNFSRIAIIEYNEKRGCAFEVGSLELNKKTGNFKFFKEA